MIICLDQQLPDNIEVFLLRSAIFVCMDRKVNWQQLFRLCVKSHECRHLQAKTSESTACYTLTTCRSWVCSFFFSAKRNVRTVCLNTSIICLTVTPCTPQSLPLLLRKGASNTAQRWRLSCDVRFSKLADADVTPPTTEWVFWAWVLLFSS